MFYPDGGELCLRDSVQCFSCRTNCGLAGLLDMPFVQAGQSHGNIRTSKQHPALHFGFAAHVKRDRLWKCFAHPADHIRVDTGTDQNLRTAMSALDRLGLRMEEPGIRDALIHTAARTGFHGRWETLSDDPHIICDIGHNAHGLKYNFHQLGRMLSDGECTSLIIVYGSVSDKDYESVFPLMPENAAYVFTNASGRRALPAGDLKQKYTDFCGWSGRPSDNTYCASTVGEAVDLALDLYRKECSGNGTKPLIYIGGSTYVVSEAVDRLRLRR